MDTLENKKFKVKHSPLMLKLYNQVAKYIQKVAEHTTNTMYDVTVCYHIFEDENNPDYISIIVFVLRDKFNQELIKTDKRPPIYNEFSDFKSFINSIREFRLNMLCGNPTYVSADGFELRIRPRGVQYFVSYVPLIAYNTENRLPDGTYNMTTVNNSDQHGFNRRRKTYSTMSSETFSKYTKTLQFTVNKNGIWGFRRDRQGNGKGRHVINAHSVNTFTTWITGILLEPKITMSLLVAPIYSIYDNNTINVVDEKLLLLAIDYKSYEASLLSNAPNIPRAIFSLKDFSHDSIVQTIVNTIKVPVTRRFISTVSLTVKVIANSNSVMVGSMVEKLALWVHIYNNLKSRDAAKLNDNMVHYHKSLMNHIRNKHEIKSPLLETLIYNMFNACGTNHRTMYYKDTVRMALQLGVPIEFNSLSTNNIRAYHDRLTKRTRYLEMSPVEPKEDNYPYVHDNLQKGDYEAVLINSKSLLIQESSDLSHCVHSYANTITSGQSIIYSITYKEKRYTLEIKRRVHSRISKTEDGPFLVDHVGDPVKMQFYINQLKGLANKSAPDELHELINYDLQVASEQANESFKYSNSDVAVAV